MTVNLLIRDVPDDVRDAIAARARAQGRSMQAYLYELVRDDAARDVNLRLLAAVRDLGGGADDADPSAADVLRGERAVGRS